MRIVLDDLRGVPYAHYSSVTAHLIRPAVTAKPEFPPHI